jgi:hypothetical protein
MVSNSGGLQVKTRQASMLLKAPPCLDKNRFFASSPRLMAVSKGEAKTRGDCVFGVIFAILI